MDKKLKEEKNDNYILSNNEEIILRLKDPKHCYQYALYNYTLPNKVDKTGIKAHMAVVLESKNPMYCYMFARDIKGLDSMDIKELEKVVLESKNPEYSRS